MVLTRQRPLQKLIEPKPAILSSALKGKSKSPRIYNLGRTTGFVPRHLNLSRV